MMSQGNDLYFEANVTNPFTILKALSMCSLNNNLLFRLCKDGLTQETEEERKRERARLDWSPFLSSTSMYHVCKKRSEPKKARRATRRLPVLLQA